MHTIRILEFKQQSKIVDGKPVVEDWVKYAPIHAVQTVQTWERVERLRPKDAIEDNPDAGERAAFIRTRWGEIEPAYAAWKSGNDIPTNGTPLAAWPGVTPDQAAALKMSGIRTVEEVASMPDHVLAKVHLPNMREMRTNAKAFLDSRGDAETAARLAKAEADNASMREQLDEALKMLAELTAPASDAPKRGRKPKAVEAEEEDEAA